jgi:UDPglucose 6-dehydrogenase
MVYMSKKSVRPKIGIVGVGWVGAQLKRYFEEFKGYKAGRDLLTYDIDPKKCRGDINQAEVVFITVPTPRKSKDGSCDISIVDDVLSRLTGSKIVVLKSTVPPGSTESFQKKYRKHKFLFNPEFLTESIAWHDMVKPDRQIVGFTKKSEEAAHLVLSLLPKAPFMSPWGQGTYQKIRITATEAEMIKYAGNVYFAQKVNWANALAKIAEKMKCDYENVRRGMSADYRIGDSHLDINHGGYRGFGGYCLAPNERLFIFNDHRHKIIKAQDLNVKAKSALSWQNGKIIVDKITAIGRRTVNGLVKFTLSKGRSLTITPDHVVTVADKAGNLKEKVAYQVSQSDYFPVVLDGYKSDEIVKIRLHEEADLSSYKVYVEKVPQLFAPKLKPHLTFNQYRDFVRARHGSTTLAACLKAGINLDHYRIKTAITGTWVPAVINVDEDFARLLGYYLAEGCVTDNRVLFTFGYKEKDLVDDLQSILNKLSIKFSERINYWQGRPSVRAVKISSRILSAYFKKFGPDGASKHIPYYIFHSRHSIKDNLLAGLLRGDGSIFKSNMGNYWTVNFATASQFLAEGVDALLREKGILASIGKVKTAKTKSDTWSLDICEFESVKALLPLFTKRQTEKVKILSGRKIKSPAYIRVKNLALLPIKAAAIMRKITEVVSLETKNHRYITSWGILTHNCLPKDISAFMHFVKEKGVNDVHNLLMAAWKFNKDLLAEQGLTYDDVSKHITEIELKKKKKK